MERLDGAHRRGIPARQEPGAAGGRAKRAAGWPRGVPELGRGRRERPLWDQSGRSTLSPFQSLRPPTEQRREAAARVDAAGPVALPYAPALDGCAGRTQPQLTMQYTLESGEETEFRDYMERPVRVMIAPDAPGVHVTWLEVGNRTRIEGTPAAESVSGFPVEGGRMLRVRLRNMGPTTRHVRLDLLA